MRMLSTKFVAVHGSVSEEQKKSMMNLEPSTAVLDHPAFRATGTLFSSRVECALPPSVHAPEATVDVAACAPRPGVCPVVTRVTVRVKTAESVPIRTEADLNKKYLTHKDRENHA